jgi:glycosyltransferase involved in cell wall biosynthesis
MFLRLEANRLQAYERDACDRYDRVVWVTEEDRRSLTSSSCARRDSVIPIATDPTQQRPLRRIRPFRVTFLGGLHWPPNAEAVSWFANTIWPRVARALPPAVLTLIGKHGRTPVTVPPNLPRVEIAGYVSDPERLLAETAVFIVPLRAGAGMRVKILDAWCWGLPVVSTAIGAEGLKASHGDNLLIADDADGFSDAVVTAFSNRHLAQRLADGGRSTVEQHYDWQRVYKAWDEIYA